MHCETLLRLSIEKVNFTSVRKTNIALSVLKAKQWTTTVCKNCKKGETLTHYDKTSIGEKLGGGLQLTPQQNGKILVGELAQWTGGRTPPAGLLLSAKSGTDTLTDKRTDTVPFHRPCCTFYTGSANNEAKHYSCIKMDILTLNLWTKGNSQQEQPVRRKSK